MQKTPTQRGWLHFVTFVTAAASAASAVFWALGGATGSASMANPLEVQTTPLASSIPKALSLAQSLGASSSASSGTPSADPAQSQVPRLRLLGVVAGSSDDKPGFALVSVDGGAPKTYAVGAKVTDNWVLRSVQRRSATLGADAIGAALVTIELPKTSSP